MSFSFLLLRPSFTSIDRWITH
uniref:Uncharacterized protein n=1 Tax=Arundo donax TaxID=35708 RepID=A0A0A9FA70_ARUDO